MSPSGPRSEGSDLDPLVARLNADELSEIVGRAAERHQDVARAVRLAAGRGTGGLGQLRAEIDRALRTRRFLGYYESRGWAQAARPIVDEIRKAVSSAPSAELVTLIERAISRVVKVICEADDSDGLIGNVARDLLDLHGQACDAGVADPIRLAQWMVRFRFDDQDFFDPDPVRYAKALGERGLAAYRREVGRRIQANDGDHFAARYAEERLAVLDGDTEAIVRLLGGDLSAPHHFIRVAEAMEELGRDDDVLAWAARGIAETSGWQVAQLYDLAAGVHARRGDDQELLRLRRDQHHRMPSLTTYSLLRQAARAGGAWETERPRARSVLAAKDLGGLVDVLIGEDEADSAWQVALDNAGWDPGRQRWARLAQAREPSVPADALEVYLRLADLELKETGRAAYTRAAVLLQEAARAAKAANREEEFAEHLAMLRDRHRRRPAFISVLDEAALPQG